MQKNFWYNTIYILLNHLQYWIWKGGIWINYRATYNCSTVSAGQTTVIEWAMWARKGGRSKSHLPLYVQVQCHFSSLEMILMQFIGWFLVFQHFCGTSCLVFLHGRGLELEKYYVGISWDLTTSSDTLVIRVGDLADWHLHLHLYLHWHWSYHCLMGFRIYPTAWILKRQQLRVFLLISYFVEFLHPPWTSHLGTYYWQV